MSIGRYFTEMLDPAMTWDDVVDMQLWNGQFCLKGIMSVADAKRAVKIGCTGIVLSNHGDRSSTARGRRSNWLKSWMPSVTGST